MPVGIILLTVTAVLVYFGVAERVLDRMKLNDKTALLFIIAMIIGSFLPEIPLARNLSINIGGGLIPIALAVYLIVSAEEPFERNRALIASITAGAVVYGVGRFLSGEPEQIFLDPIYMFGILAGLVAYLIGRSRRGAFTAGILGVVISDLAYAVENYVTDTPGKTAIGGSGILDSVVISGLLAVILAEVIGETREKLQGGTQKVKNRENNNDTFTSMITDDEIIESTSDKEDNNENKNDS